MGCRAIRVANLDDSPQTCNFSGRLPETYLMKHVVLQANSTLALLILALALAGTGAQARIEVLAPFDEAAFAKAQDKGEIIIVESYVGWCLACKIQAPMLAQLRTEPEFRAVRLFKIGEYTPKPIWKRFQLKAYGVLILYRGHEKIGRLAGAKSELELRAFIRKATP